MIIIFGGQKGGSGKSTHAANNAVWVAKSTPHLLVVDFDPQGSMHDFKVEREERGQEPFINCVTLQGDGVARQLVALKERYEHIIIDCPGANSKELRLAMTVADKLVTPCRPARFDRNTMVWMSQTIADTRIVNPNLQALAFLNAVSTNVTSKRAERARAFILEYCTEYRLLESMVMNRVSHEDVAELGLSLDELPNRDMQAITEAESIFKEIWL